MCRPRRIGYVIQPHEDAWYILPPGEQDDWLKFFGVAFSWRSNQQDSVMVAGRYWPETDKWHFTSYMHINGYTIKGKNGQDGPMIECERGQKVYAWIDIDYSLKSYCVSFSTEPESLWDETESFFTHSRKLGRRIGIYFGSDQVAPREFHVTLKKIRRWTPIGLPAA